MLRSDPSFTRLPAGDQQRLVQQLHQVNQMPEQQRERRLARAELLEHMSPQDRMAANRSALRWRTLPANRQAVMGSAFRDLSAVPPEQRQMVLNSARYQNAFSPEERGILTDVLRAEPYQAPR
jgi:phage-related protein